MKLIADFFASLLLNIASWILAAMGLPVVWFALYFVKPSGAPIPFTQFPELGFWQMWNLPAWAITFNSELLCLTSKCLI